MKFINGHCDNRDGAAIQIRGPYGSYATIDNCEFVNNENIGGYGGAICCDGRNSTIKNCKFKTNYCTSHGGAIHVWSSYCKVMNCEFTDNEGSSGSGIYWEGNYGSLSSSRFTTSRDYDSVVYWFGDNGTITNCKSYAVSKTNNLIVSSKSTKVNGFDIIIQSGDSSNPIKLTLKKVTVKKSAKKLVLTATLKKGSKALKGKKITFKFNGKTYTSKTSTKGTAKATVKKSALKKLKVGTKIKYQASYGKLTVKNTAKVQK